MSLPVFWIPEANSELKRVQAWYEDKRSERFAHAAVATVQAISETPLQFPVVYRELRREVCGAFPFRGEEDRVVILACFHGRRDPRSWPER